MFVSGKIARMRKRYLDDLNDGESLHCKPVEMRQKDILDFGKAFDPQPFHVDEAAARQSVFGGLVASSLHTLSACTRAVVEAQGDVAILSGVGMHEARMFNPVRPGDILTVEAWWCDIERAKTKPDRGFASIRCKVRNQNREPVIEYGYRYLVARRRE